MGSATTHSGSPTNIPGTPPIWNNALRGLGDGVNGLVDLIRRRGNGTDPRVIQGNIFFMIKVLYDSLTIPNYYFKKILI